METPLCLITVFLVLLIMAVMEGAAVSDMRILSGAPAPSYSCEGKGFYTYESFIAAANSFPAFGNTGSSNDSRMEVAAFLANVVDMSQEFCYVAPSNVQPSCNESSTNSSCANGDRYFARGPLRLTGNNNYEAAGKYLKLDLLGNPDKVSENSTISFQTAIWLWMNGSNSHTAIVHGQGFAATVKALNSSACDDHPKLKSMVNNYKAYCKYFGVSPGLNLENCLSETVTLPAGKPIPPKKQRKS